jgi:hypothetical protein
MGLLALGFAALFPIAALTMTSGCPASTGEGEGEGEGEGGAEGEGEGEGAGEGEGEGSCGGLDAQLPAGGGTVTASDSTLSADATNTSCTAAGTNACTAITGTSCFSFDITVSGATEANVKNANWIAWKNTGGDDAVFAANSCNGGAVGCAANGTDLICTCGLCLTAAPTDLAAQLIDSTDGNSNGICVNIQ